MNEKKTKISVNIDENIAQYKKIFADCADIKMRPMWLGVEHGTLVFRADSEVAVINTLLENKALGRLLVALEKIP